MGFKEFVEKEKEKSYFHELKEKIDKEYETYTIYPPRKDIFRCMNLTTYEDVKVVILGQDPYHEPSQANGLAFSVYPGVKVPPSLVNIFKECHDDVGIDLGLKSVHPSPLSSYRGFFGSKPFSKTNQFLIEHNIDPIDWQIENI